jgi:antitoxin HicB
MTVGADREEALQRVHGALVAMLAARVQDRETIPRPAAPARGQRVAMLPPMVAAKLTMYQAMRARQITTENLARRLGWEHSRVCNAIDPRRRSRLEDIEAALAALGKRLVIDVENAA